MNALRSLGMNAHMKLPYPQSVHQGQCYQFSWEVALQALRKRSFTSSSTWIFHLEMSRIGCRTFWMQSKCSSTEPWLLINRCNNLYCIYRCISKDGIGHISRIEKLWEVFPLSNLWKPNGAFFPLECMNSLDGVILYNLPRCLRRFKVLRMWLNYNSHFNRL